MPRKGGLAGASTATTKQKKGPQLSSPKTPTMIVYMGLAAHTQLLLSTHGYKEFTQ
jgi:hypothetical protein